LFPRPNFRLIIPPVFRLPGFRFLDIWQSGAYNDFAMGRIDSGPQAGASEPRREGMRCISFLLILLLFVTSGSMIGRTPQKPITEYYIYFKGEYAKHAQRDERAFTTREAAETARQLRARELGTHRETIINGIRVESVGEAEQAKEYLENTYIQEVPTGRYTTPSPSSPSPTRKTSTTRPPDSTMPTNPEMDDILKRLKGVTKGGVSFDGDGQDIGGRLKDGTTTIPSSPKDEKDIVRRFKQGISARDPEIAGAIGELAAMSPVTLDKVRQDIARREEAPNPEVNVIVRSFKGQAPPPLAGRFDQLKVGDVLLLRQPDNMLSLGFHKAGWIIILDKAMSATLRARASHTFMFVKEVKGVRLFLDNMPGQGTRIKTEDQITAEYPEDLDVAIPLSALDADKLWAASREAGIRSLKEFANRADNWVDTTDYGPYGDNDMVCSETSRWALMKAGLVIPKTRSFLKQYVGGVDFGPADFYTDTKNFLVKPLEQLRIQDHK
jgi:hypothetical protein